MMGEAILALAEQGMCSWGTGLLAQSTGNAARDSPREPARRLPGGTDRLT